MQRVAPGGEPRSGLGSKSPRVGWPPRASIVAAFVLLGGALGSALGAEDDLPRAAFIDKITWMEGKGVTRLRFQADRAIVPTVARASALVLRVDLTATSGGSAPSFLEVGTREVRDLRRLPDSVQEYLPEGVSERYLVELARDDVSWSVRTDGHGFTLFVGDADRASGTQVVANDTGWFASILGAGHGGEEPPSREELLAAGRAFVIAASQPLRSGPSPLAAEMGRVRAGQTVVADGQSGDWLHLVTGGWVQQATAPSPATPREVAEAPVRASRAQRSPLEWSVVTLGTGLGISVIEVLPEDAEATTGGASKLFAEPVRFARLEVRAPAQSRYGFRLPPKEGRLELQMKDGRRVLSRDPFALPLAAGVTRGGVEAAFASDEIAAGDTWTGLLVLPPDLDFFAVSEARVDVGGQLNLLFQVPGSGEPTDGGERATTSPR